MKTIERVWLDSRQLKQMKEQLTFVASDSLKNELDSYIQNHEREGAYLGNIFNDDALVELKKLNEKFGIMPLCFKI